MNNQLKRGASRARTPGHMKLSESDVILVSLSLSLYKSNKMPLAIDLPLFLFLLLSVVTALLLASSGWSSSKIAREWKRTEGGGRRAGR